EAAAAHDDDDDVVERVGLGLPRAAPVVLAQDADDAGRDRCQYASRAHALGWRNSIPYAWPRARLGLPLRQRNKSAVTRWPPWFWSVTSWLFWTKESIAVHRRGVSS